jgi:predicted porin
MKKSLIALAVLGSFAGVAAAQSSVTLFGIADVAVRHSNNGTTTKKSEDSGAESTSRFGLRGTEDLGGGLSAGFWLESGINLDNGTSSDTTKFWNRRATVSLISQTAGEVRLGRDTLPLYNQYNSFSPFSVIGVGGLQNLIPALGGQDRSRSDNTVSYTLPGNLGGVYGQVLTAAGEGSTTTNKHSGARLGYAEGPINVSVAYGQTTLPNNSTKVKETGIAGSYDFGVVKLIGQYLNRKLDSYKASKTYELAATAPVGNGVFKVAYVKLSDFSTTPAVASTIGAAKQFSLGYVYNVSKRTALYTTYSRIQNTNLALTTSSSLAAGTKGEANTGTEVGIRHNF